jgi:hypothetical protein
MPRPKFSTRRFATKLDIADLGGRISAVDGKLTMLMWIVGLNFAAMIGVLVKHW